MTSFRQGEVLRGNNKAGDIVPRKCESGLG